MLIEKTEIEGLVVIEPMVFRDPRGCFFEAWNEKIYKQNNINFIPVQQNESSSKYGVIRGLHYQLNPHSQAKLVRVLIGKVLDVAVDLRKNSSTYGKCFSVILSEENKKQFFIPKGFAHGFSVLSESAVFSYLCDEYYHHESERSILYNDKFLNIDWKISEQNCVVSEKDLKGLSFIEAEKNF